VLVGIGGSNLGTEAVHEALGGSKVTLHTLDTAAAYQLEEVLQALRKVKDVKKIAVCVISKSGNTTETLVNASVLLEALETQFKKAIYRQTIFIGDPKTKFLQAGKRLKVTTIEMPTIVGGRYSVATEVGLVPLALLGHDVDSFMSGVVDASSEEFESLAAEGAVRVTHYLKKKYRHYNFFAFDPRLERLGAWYRQLFAESLGKAEDKSKQPVTAGMVPTISTPVELHSVGQLYLSGFAGVYTDFVTFDDLGIDFSIPKTGLAKAFGKFDVQEISTAIYGGVVGAYQERSLPYRSVIFDDKLEYSLGLFMGMRMLETMYIANLLNLNAFDQPNVELYKTKTKEILGV
jgi:glucose-6-phosphate isomerase